MGRAFSTSYLARDAAACAFFPQDFRDAAARSARARAAAQRTVKQEVVDVLRAQQTRLPPSPARQTNLDALAAGQTAVVVTGQQVGLFLGPLYTFYKAASAIAVARAIQAQAGIRCVPLFWLQTEDHDFAEIAHCTVAGAGGVPVRLALADEPAAEVRTSVAHRVLGAEISGLVDALAETLGQGPAAVEVMAVVRAHYVAGRPVALAFAGALAEIFGDEGLLFLDPRDDGLAALVAPIHRRAIEDLDAIDATLGRRADALAAAGFGEQVPLRPGTCLTFFHAGSATGPRFRPRRRGGGALAAWQLSGPEDTIAHEDLLALLARDPLRFSTSSLLRPIVQDALLPTVAYVGGPAEVTYLAQLAPVYAHFGLEAPLVVPRARFRCVDGRARRSLAAMGLTPDDLSRPVHELPAAITVARAEGVADPAALRDLVSTGIAPLVAEIADAVVKAEPNLARAAARTRASVAHALGRLTDRYARALLDRDAVASGKLERLRNDLFPGGVPQERVLGWPSLAARIGPATFKRLVLEQLANEGAFVTDVRDIYP